MSTTAIESLQANDPIQVPDEVCSANLNEEVSCPLCSYDLRGTGEPRCPECGFRFAWGELLDPSRRRHPYLFEHHPECNVRSFFRTLKGGLRPKRFWKQLHPAQPSRPGRLRGYFFVVAGWLAPAVILGVLIPELIQHSSSSRQYRNWLTIAIRSPNPPAWTVNMLAGYPSVEAFLDDKVPKPWSLRGIKEILFVTAHGRSMSSSVGLGLALVMWPILSYAAFQIFRWSMRRARIRPIHVERCVVYSADLAAWLALILLLGLPPTQILGSQGIRRIPQALIVLVFGGALAIFVYRLSQAYKLYLRFDRPFLTVLAAQAVVALAMLNLYSAFIAVTSR